jgi:hypothetical protein
MASENNFNSVEAILHEFYEALQFGAGEEPDYQRILHCFHAEAIVTPPMGDTGGVLRVLSCEQFVVHLKRLLTDVQSGREYQVSTRNEVFGNVASAFSRYEFAVGDKVVSSGVNSFQLMHDHRRWWIMGLAWDRAPK